MAGWIQFEKAWNEFKNRGLAQTGVLVEVVDGKRWSASKGLANGDVYLLGDINKLAGVCDDCVAFSNTDVVKRYRVIITKQDLEAR